MVICRIRLNLFGDWKGIFLFGLTLLLALLHLAFSVFVAILYPGPLWGYTLIALPVIASVMSLLGLFARNRFIVDSAMKYHATLGFIALACMTIFAYKFFMEPDCLPYELFPNTIKSHYFQGCQKNTQKTHFFIYAVICPLHMLLSGISIILMFSIAKRLEGRVYYV